MIKGSEIRKADFPIEPLLLDRWSPRAMSGEEIAEKELMQLFEAARWAPSSFNAQQWRALYARRGTEHWPVFFDLLVEGNKSLFGYQPPIAARRHGGDQKPFGPSVETFAGEQSEQNDQASKNSDQADQYMNDCVDVQYHDRPITVTFTRNVTFRCNSSTLTSTHCPGICVSFVGSSVYCASQPPSTTSEVPTVNFASSEQR